MLARAASLNSASKTSMRLAEIRGPRTSLIALTMSAPKQPRCEEALSSSSAELDFAWSTRGPIAEAASSVDTCRRALG
jgi:hypothetical protein